MPAQNAAPHLTLEIERHGTTTLVRCHGKLVYGVTDVLYSQVSELIPESRRIVLDLTDLSFMDSMGLGTLMRLYVSARTKGCTVELIHIGKRVRELLELTKIISVFASVGRARDQVLSRLKDAGRIRTCLQETSLRLSAEGQQDKSEFFAAKKAK